MSVVFTAFTKPKQIIRCEGAVPVHSYWSYSYCFPSTQTSAEKLSTAAVCSSYAHRDISKNLHSESWIYKDTKLKAMFPSHFLMRILKSHIRKDEWKRRDLKKRPKIPKKDDTLAWGGFCFF